jgi:hypothetical protein
MRTLRPLLSLAFTLLASSLFLSISLLRNHNPLSKSPQSTHIAQDKYHYLTDLPQLSPSTRAYLDKLFLILLPNATLPTEELNQFYLTSATEDEDMLTVLLHGTDKGGTDGLVEEVRRNQSTTKWVTMTDAEVPIKGLGKI